MWNVPKKLDNCSKPKKISDPLLPFTSKLTLDITYKKTTYYFTKADLD